MQALLGIALFLLVVFILLFPVIYISQRNYKKNLESNPDCAKSHEDEYLPGYILAFLAGFSFVAIGAINLLNKLLPLGNNFHPIFVSFESIHSSVLLFSGAGLVVYSYCKLKKTIKSGQLILLLFVHVIIIFLVGLYFGVHD